MKTSATGQGKTTANYRLHKASFKRQKGMGATIILFTIALIVLVGAALAYASRGNPKAITTEGAKVYSGTLLKQSADFRDGYSRYIFDGGVPADMKFNDDLADAKDLFNPTLQLATYQPPPSQATTVAAPALPAWLYNKAIAVDGVGTTSADSVAYVANVTEAVCRQLNFQMYGSTIIPTSIITDAAAFAAATEMVTVTATPGRSNGCIQLSGGSGTYLFYSTLGEA